MQARRLLDAQQTVLLVIDIQEKFVPVIQNSGPLIERTGILIETAKQLDIPILISEQYPEGLGPTASQLLEKLPSSATRLEKTAFGCLGDHAMAHYFQALGRQQVMVCGIEAHVCVNQTVHQLLESGYEPHLIEDAISSRDLHHCEIALNKMRQSGAVDGCVEMAVFELMRHAKHPDFKALQALIK